jgi:hypothetical protein
MKFERSFLKKADSPFALGIAAEIFLPKQKDCSE